MRHTFGELLTVNAAARYIGTSKQTVESWLEAGHLEAYVTPGGTWRRIRKTDVDDFLDTLERHPGKTKS